MNHLLPHFNLINNQTRSTDCYKPFSIWDSIHHGFLNSLCCESSLNLWPGWWIRTKPACFGMKFWRVKRDCRAKPNLQLAQKSPSIFCQRRNFHPRNPSRRDTEKNLHATFCLISRSISLGGIMTMHSPNSFHREQSYTAEVLKRRRRSSAKMRKTKTERWREQCREAFQSGNCVHIGLKLKRTKKQKVFFSRSNQ